MKIVCQKCTAQYEVQENLIPPSGLMMRCPACLHTFAVKPPGGPVPSLAHDEDEFTPPGARAARAAAAIPSAPMRAPALPPAGGMVSPVRPSTHDTAQDAELPVPKRAGRGESFGGVPEIQGIQSSRFSTHSDEAADLPAPKRAMSKTALLREDLGSTAPPEGPALVPPPPSEAPMVAAQMPISGRSPIYAASDHENLPAPVRAQAGRGPSYIPREEADLPAPVGPTASISDLPAPVRRATSGANPVPSYPPGSPAGDPAEYPPGLPSGDEPDEPDNLPAPRRASLHSAAPPPGPARLSRSPAAAQSAELDLMDELGLQPLDDLDNLPAPVEAPLPTPVKADLLAPVKADLMAPVEPDLLDSAGRSGAPFIDDAGRSQPPLALDDSEPIGLELDDLPPPPPRHSAPPTLDVVSAVARPAAKSVGAELDMALEIDRPVELAPSVSSAAVSRQSAAPGQPSTTSRVSRQSAQRPPQTNRAPNPASERDELDEVADQLTQPIPPEARTGTPPPRAPRPVVKPAHDDALDALGLESSLGDLPDLPDLGDLPGSAESPLPEGDAAGDAAGTNLSNVDDIQDGQEIHEVDDDALAAALPAPGATETAAAPGKKKRLSRRTLAIGAAACVLLLAGAGAGAYFFLVAGHRSAQEQADFVEARTLLGDDMLPSYRKAAERFHDLLSKNSDDEEARAMEAQARLGAARFGLSAEQKTAEERLGQIPADHSPSEVVEARALRDLLANKPDSARRALEPILRTATPRKDFLAPLYLGWVELRAGKGAAAEKAFRTALRVQPQLPAAQLGLAQLHEREGDRETANTEYGKVLKLKPSHFAAAMGQLRTGKDAGNETKILAILNKSQASAAPRELAETWAQLGVTALTQTRLKDAEDRFRKALAADSTLPAPQVGLARILCDQDKFTEAADLAGKALKSEPNNVEAALVQVRALLGSKKPLDAGAPLDVLLKQAPKDARVYYWQGRREEDVTAADSDTKAAASYRKALDLNPRYLDAYIALSRVLAHQGKTTDALAALKQAAEQTQGDPDMANSLGEAYLAVGDYAKAMEAARLALGKKPDMNRARMNLAIALERTGHLDAAADELAKIEARDKAYPGLAERRAAILLRQGNYDEAQKIYLVVGAQPGASAELRLDAAAATLRDHPAEAEAMVQGVVKEDIRSVRGLTLLALIKLKQEDLPEASKQIERAVRISDSPEVQMAHGQILLAMGRKSDALSAFAAARKAPVEGMAMAAHIQLLNGQGQTQEVLDELNDLIDRQKALFSNRTYYRPEDVADILGNAYLLKGDLSAATQKDDDALKAYDSAVHQLRKSGEAAFRYGRALYGASKRGPAIQQLKTALALGGDKAPYALETYLLLGDSYRQTHQKSEAVRAYNKWIALAPPNSPERRDVDRYLIMLQDAHHR